MDGILDLSGWQIVVWTLISCHITLLGVTIYLHRAMAHRALDLHPAVSHFFRFWLWLTTGMVTVQWVAIHRKHHAHCETDEDPHSPQVLGLRRVFFQGAELYQDAAKRPEIMEKYGRGCPNDWLERNVYSRFPWLGISALLVIEFMLMGMWGVSVFAVQMMCIPLLAAGVINGVGHYWGYRNYECNDAATNVSPWGIVIVGEELHNNHHAYPSSAKFALRPWEFDLGWMYIRALQAVGLAKVRRVAPAPTLDSAKSQIDIETVKALISSRLHVMQDYASNVLKPVHQNAVQATTEPSNKTVLAKAKKALIAAPVLLDEKSRDRIAEAIHLDEQLQAVYEAREKLAEIWGIANASHERLVQAFVDWCNEAEQSGIAALEEFAERMRHYALKPQGVLNG